MPQWTREQLRAIEARGGNVLLSAAAGSGKTTVLVERALRLVTEAGADVDRMLVVTFTRAAASDMRAKLNRALNERALQGGQHRVVAASGAPADLLVAFEILESQCCHNPTSPFEWPRPARSRGTAVPGPC